MRDLIASLDIVDGYKSDIIVSALENLIELTEPVNERLIYEPDQNKRHKNVQRQEQYHDRSLFLKSTGDNVAVVRKDHDRICLSHIIDLAGIADFSSVRFIDGLVRTIDIHVTVCGNDYFVTITDICEHSVILT